MGSSASCNCVVDGNAITTSLTVGGSVFAVNPMRVFTRLSFRVTKITAVRSSARTRRPEISEQPGYRRRAGLGLSLATTSLGIAGCDLSWSNTLDGIAQHFGPAPEQSLVSLAFSAEDEAASFAATDPVLSELRAQQAGALFDEIARVCGHYPDGTAPATCAIDRTERSGYDGEHAVAESAEQALDQLLGSLTDAPADSHALLIEQAVVLAQHVPELEKAITAARDNLISQDAKAPDSWSEMTDWEYRLGFGLESARAFRNGEGANATENAAAESDARLATLRQLGIAMPERALSYHAGQPNPEFPGVAPELNDDNAAEFVETALQQTAQQWKLVALGAKDTEWRKLAVLFAAETNRVLG